MIAASRPAIGSPAYREEEDMEVHGRIAAVRSAVGLSVGTLALAVAAVLAVPAAAQAAASDLAISQNASSHVVKAGDVVTLNITVTNVGTGPPPYGGVFVEVDSLRAHGQAANNPYQSFSSSQGSCSDQSAVGYGGQVYHFLVCDLGNLAPGASAQIVANVKVNDTAVHTAVLLPSASEGGYEDDDNSNNSVSDRITVSTPPVLKGSKQIKLKGLPDGCVPGDFTLKVTAAVAAVKKVRVSLDLGFDQNGDGQTFQKSANGKHLQAKVPVSRIFDPVLGKLYTLKVKVKRRGAGPLKRTVTFELC
jgi:hypothetical protein